MLHTFAALSLMRVTSVAARAWQEQMAKTIVIVGTLDTKGEELKYIKELVERRGHTTIVIDGGVLGEPFFQADISREQVAHASGMNLNEVATLSDERKAMTAMGEGVARMVRDLHSEGKIDGIIGIGGLTGTQVVTLAMHELPTWFPKLLLSTVAFAPFFRTEALPKDVTVMPTVIDPWGLNEVTKMVLNNAAGAIAGMVEERRPIQMGKPLIGITTFGTVVCKHPLWAKPLLERKGYEIIVLEPLGSTFEEIIERGLIAGALDFIAGSLILNEICNGLVRPGPHRFNIGKRGIPLVFAPAVADIFGWSGLLNSLPKKLKGRKSRQHDAFIRGVKARPEEMAETGRLLAQKLNVMKAPTAMLIPLRGFSEWDRPGGIFHNPEGRQAFIESFKNHIEAKVKTVELDLHVNDPEFSEQAVAILDNMMKGKFES